MIDRNFYWCRMPLVWLGLLLLLTPFTRVGAWDETGHVVVTRIAHKSLPASMPAWIKTPEVRARLEYLSAEPDRWRGLNGVVLDHINNPDHYLDIDELAQYDLSLGKLPMLRREFLDHLATQRALHPEKFEPYEREKDREYTRKVPGLLPWTIIELEEKITSSWTTLNTFEKYRDRVTDDMIRNARENIVFHMGVLSHFVGDGAQPLHTTVNYNGWVEANPKGYTTSRKFHAYIDGDVLVVHKITPDSLLDRARAPARLTVRDAWPRICDYLGDSHAYVEPLYEQEKSGELNKEPGKRLIEGRLLAGGAMLAGLWSAAYDGTVTDTFLENKLRGNDSRATSQPESSPSAP